MWLYLGPEGTGMTPPVSMKGVAEWATSVNPVGIQNHLSVGLLRERSDRPTFLHLGLEVIPS